MKRFFILGILLVALLASGLIFRSIQSNDNLAQGEESPELIVENNDSVVDLSSFGGKYVLVDFWSASDAQSRIKSNEYNALDLESDPNVERVSINFDRSKRLFEEIVSRDNLNRETQYHVDRNEADRIIRDFDLKDGYKSYLIAPDGRIEAVNPPVSYLMRKFRA